jgi:CheY-like chemotaxis protein
MVASPVSAGQKPPLVLVVDDYSDTRDMYAQYLDWAGMRAETAENGRQAVRRALRAHPAVIVMDLAMPVLDGWEATRILHADPRTKDIPIIVLTGNAQPDQKKRAQECGALLVLTKPCAPRDLHEVVLKVIAESKAAPPARRSS